MGNVSEVLLKTARFPGLCSATEIEQSLTFLNEFNKALEIYRSAYGEPTGMSVLSKIDALDWYVQNQLTP